MTANLQVALGASGGTGRALVDELHRSGYRVRAVSRHLGADLPGGVEAVRGDITHPEEVRRAVAGAAVVFHTAQPAYHRWPEEFPTMTATVADAGALYPGRPRARWQAFCFFGQRRVFPPPYDHHLVI
jgi:NAD(P)-dependent dehydrogenase (short-subunit alcohol dehydrogenase family)